jgi:hypothetical protein
MSCPEDFGLVSFDDYPWLRCFRPRLTTIELPKYELGAKSAQLLLDRIAGKKGRSTIQRLGPQLCVRESCGFTLQLRSSNREGAPHVSQMGKKIEPGARPALVREKVAGDAEGSAPTHD